ncbi:uncharacterized protein LOC126668387 [Mercurialis annua]|uniref:uncharacterized protein LOC126668387 n=1 Tax=Mercurialis annua TaxID=3986 RepID=UPI00215F5724|nr:uncharacterized protein LOC126668387 [Mercurialis annua]
MIARHKELWEKIKQLASLYELATGKLEDDLAQVQDDLLEINLGTVESPRPIYINAGLTAEFKEQLIALLNEFRDCFAWSYDEMSGLDPNIAQHKLPIKSGFTPFRQPPRRISREVDTLIQDEIKRLDDVKFIREAQYTEWLSNIVPVMKRNGKLRVCVDFRNLNLATPKDEYPMSVADMLIDRVAGHTVLSFLDAHSGYNQVPISKDDVSKTAFRCPRPIGAYEWVVMPFGLKNAGATYQRAMSKMFRGLDCLEVYIDDVVVKSNTEEVHLADLRIGFERIRANGLKMNPFKCAFGVSDGNFLGFLVHQRGVETYKNKAKAIINAEPPKTKKQLQRLNGQINFLRRFIANTAGRLRSWSVLLRGKETDQWVWTNEQQKVFDDLKGYLAKPPVMTPPKPNKPMLLYLSAAHESMGCMLAQEDNGVERAVYYLSHGLTDTEICYTDIEKMFLCLYFTRCKLRYYMLPAVVCVLSQTDIIKYILSKPYLRNRIGKWAIAMSEFTLVYVPQRAVKGQALADFLADHPRITLKEETISCCDIDIWEMWLDGSRTSQGAGAGVHIVSPLGASYRLSFKLWFECTNNQAEYEALIFGLEILAELGEKEIDVRGDSLLVIKQVIGEFKCESELLVRYCNKAKHLIEGFQDTKIEYTERAQHENGYKMNLQFDAIKRETPNLHTGGITIDERNFSVYQLDITQDWRTEILRWFEKPDQANRRIRTFALNYVVLAGELYKNGFEGLLFRCIGPKEAMLSMAEVHEGIAGVHQRKIEQDCIRYAKGCEACQKCGPIQHVPDEELHSIIKPWPFRGWAVDLIGKIYPGSSDGHTFVIIANCYFTKWVEAKPLKLPTQEAVIKFLKEYIVHRHGLPESITIDQGTIFTGSDIVWWASQMKIKMLHSTLYYAQANGQAEATNKAIKLIVQKIIEENPRQWHVFCPKQFGRIELARSRPQGPHLSGWYMGMMQCCQWSLL